MVPGITAITFAILLALPCAAFGADVYQRANTAIDPSRMSGPASEEWDTPPKLIEGKAPVYPISLVLSRREGSSVIVYTVGIDGKARDFEVESTTDQKYANHAIIALKAWRFEPATKGGVPVEARLRQKFSFGIR